MTTRMASTAIWLRIFCATLLLSLGFAHKPLYAAPAADPAGSYYLLPDGSFAGLCIDDADHGKPAKSWLGSGCDLCRLASSMLPPAPSGDPISAVRGHRAAAFSIQIAFLDEACPRPGSPVRGPPPILS